MKLTTLSIRGKLGANRRWIRETMELWYKTGSFPFFCPRRRCSDPKSNQVSKQTDLTQPISLQT